MHRIRSECCIREKIRAFDDFVRALPRVFDVRVLLVNGVAVWGVFRA